MERPSEIPNPSGSSRRASDPYVFGALAAVCVIAAFVGGVFFGQSRVAAAPANPPGEGRVTDRNAPPPYMLKDVDFANFWDIWKMVKERYVGQPVSDVKLYYGALEGMVGSLGDPYSVYFDPEVAKKFNEELQGSFDGIGAEIGIKDNFLTVIAPLAGSPAEKAGLKSGDKILAIEGKDTAGVVIDDAVSRIRGKKGTTVKLTVAREGWKEPKEFSVVRDTITIESVSRKVVTSDGKKVSVITLNHFNENTGAKFADAVRDTLLDGSQAVILDLRNNPGGYLDTAVDVAGEWIPNGLIVSEKSSDGSERKHMSSGNARLANMPTVVLTNGGSASASEIVAGALQDGGKATLVGEKTFGKGSVQDFVDLDDGSAVKLTVALWYTPKGRSINKQGIAPDDEVKLTEDDFTKKRDPQMEKALQVLTATK